MQNPNYVPPSGSSAPLPSPPMVHGQVMQGQVVQGQVMQGQQAPAPPAQQQYQQPQYQQPPQYQQQQYQQQQPPPPQPQPSSVHMTINDGGVREFLSLHNWPPGLQETFIRNIARVPIRYFIVDDSGSMAMGDGHLVNKNTNGSRSIISCTRWRELGTAMEFHLGVSRAGCIPSEFRLLNGAPPIMIGGGDPNEVVGLQTLNIAFADSPGGGTPLCRHINEIVAKIRSMEAYLRSTGQVACLVIMTDGESSDGNVAQAMAPLKNLPVHIVLRLCTDQDKVVNYWNSVDQELELRMDVLDDLVGEAREVYEHNKFFTYAEPIQRLREFGVTVKEFDLMDEALLNMEQVKRLCGEIYGCDPNKMPSPEADWKAFCQVVEAENHKLGKVWDPRTQKMQDWISIKALSSAFNKDSCTIS